ncbi:ribonucleotide reductase, alpha subunit [Acetobacter aceti NRIC 0242]|uniref:Uncharacterized protein n=1 Tax=Acetobacter aceti NBRC 14818 TaxID=887700 RepID=A0AB33IIJ1_ACEAC|nr:hypothetical protein [Acetobacter aceti]TCS27249.1 hypothetical protein EDC15_12711 [Acetobacter aceti NBRC 14818]BCK77770.1 hypothetical protein EMQ_P214 [Acetobacter aceti NBRC 14818]GBO81999.1 ribonucleotide reductase, alpha subunit [Acetobacter aceti NRIC 0242]
MTMTPLFNAQTEAMQIGFMSFGAMRLLQDALESLDDHKEMVNLVEAALETISVVYGRANGLTGVIEKLDNATQD